MMLLTHRYILYENGVIRERIEAVQKGKIVEYLAHGRSEKCCIACNKWKTKQSFKSLDRRNLYRLNTCKECVETEYRTALHLQHYELFRAEILQRLSAQLLRISGISIKRYDIPDDLLDLEVKKLTIKNQITNHA